jgi:ribosomal-protein-alanine N-acetyltransferase
VTLTWATPADAAAMARVHAEAFAAPWSNTAFVDLLEGPGVFGLIAAEAEPQGFILCRVAAGEIEVLTLAVLPAVRRRGLAKALVLSALGAARQAGAEAAFLEVADDNPAAAALYAGLGFRRAGVRRAYYDRGTAGRADALVMRLDLGSSET